MELGLFDGKSYHDLPFIVADVHILYLAPITLLQNIQVGRARFPARQQEPEV